MINVFVADPISEEGLRVLRDESGFTVVKKTGLPESDLIKELDGSHCLLVRSETKVTGKVISAAKNLRIIGRAGVGVDNIDQQAATSKGIVVMNVPGGNTVSAAEHAVGLMLALSRNIPQANASLKSGKWERKKFVGVELFDKTLGLIGLGRIGREVCRRALSFGMKVKAYDPFASEEYARNLGVTLTELDTLYREADFISIHVPKNDQTHGMLNKQAFAKMKKTVRIINCSRGEIIKEDDLIAAVDAGQVAGAALDVFSKEPATELPIIHNDKIIVTPHLGASTEEAQVKVASELARAVVDFFKKGVVRNAINFPVLDPDAMREIEPYIKLSENLGKFLSQIISGGIKAIEIEVFGQIANYNLTPLTLAALNGVLRHVLDIDVNMVNAAVLAKERGILVKETKSTVSHDYTNLVVLTIRTEKGDSTISGNLLARSYPRIVNLDGMTLDIVPAGKMLVIRNIDQPGVIGRLGTVLGKNNINIAEMHVGRLSNDKHAITVIHVDQPVPPPVLKEVGKIKGVETVYGVELD